MLITDARVAIEVLGGTLTHYIKALSRPASA